LPGLRAIRLRFLDFSSKRRHAGDTRNLSMAFSPLRRSVNRGTPFGGNVWTKATAAHLGAEQSLHERGRPPGKRSAPGRRRGYSRRERGGGTREGQESRPGY